MQEKMKKLFNLDSFYIIFVLFFVNLIACYRNYLDIAYFLFVTFYYIRMKLHKRKIS